MLKSQCPILFLFFKNITVEQTFENVRYEPQRVQHKPRKYGPKFSKVSAQVFSRRKVAVEHTFENVRNIHSFFVYFLFFLVSKSTS